jgi:DNA modification methylase
MSEWINRIHCGDCLEVLRGMPDEVVQCVVTSPPYWGLRDYGVEGQLGLEPTPEEYTRKMVDVFREVRRVMKDDGTLWLNLGDSYASSPEGNFGPNMPTPADGGRYRENKPKMNYGSIKPKDLCGIPWRIAFALQANGWYLRQDIIWAKPNPMPESVTDRCTKAHEYLFLLTKSSKYYYDADAIKEDPQRNVSVGWKDSDLKKYSCDPRLEKQGSYKDWRKYCPTGNVEKRNKRSVWTIPTSPFPEAHFATFPPKLVEPCILAGSRQGDVVLDPFMGSGTTAIVAHILGRQWVGIELSPEYVEMSEQRIKRETQQIRMFA